MICHQEKSLAFTPYSKNITQFFIFVLSYIVYILIWFNLLVDDHDVARSNMTPCPFWPRGLPIIGNIHQLRNDTMHITFMQMAEKYGPIMYLKLGSRGVVVASTAETAHEFVKVQDLVWAGRQTSMAHEILTNNQMDIAGAPYGPYWRHLRKICAQELFTSKSLESFRFPRAQEFNQMVKSIMDEVQEGKIVQLNLKLNHLAFNNLTRMMLNKRLFGLDVSAQEEALNFKEVLFKLLKLSSTIVVGDFIPWLKWLSIVTGYRRYMKTLKRDIDSMLQEFLELKKSGKNMQEENDGGPRRQDFVDVLLTQPAENGTGHLSDTSIRCVILDMLLAGTDTSSNSVEWGIAALLRYPHCLKKLQAELDEVVGKDKTVTESDVPKLPYLNAFVKELFRLYPPAPLGISHQCMKDTTLQGYDFVAGTRLYLNIYAIHRDPKWWENPLEFDPERFIKNPDISMKGNYFHFIPFGVGRRQCPGISLGVLFVQLGLARLVQSFEFSLPDGQDPTTLDMTAKYGVTMPRKTPLKVICKPRLPKHLYYDTN
ncbi:unnamed protein product [Sphagnum compactum]